MKINNNQAKPVLTDRSHTRSLAQKWCFTLLHLSIVLFCVWLVYSDAEILGEQWRFADATRAYILLFCALLYWLRHVVTLFYLLQRTVAWSEVFGLLAFFSLFEIGLLLLGGAMFKEDVISLNGLDLVALVLLVFGSYLNSFSEIQRKWWKAALENKRHCYTQGLFRYSMHINFFGDIVLFTGWCLFTNNFWTLALPLFMLFLFVFYHIPDLDRYLSNRYGEEFRLYASKTKKLIPFVY